MGVLMVIRGSSFILFAVTTKRPAQSRLSGWLQLQNMAGLVVAEGIMGERIMALREE